MEDDIFAQLLSIVNDVPNKGSNSDTSGFGSNFVSDNLLSEDSEMFTSDDIVVPDVKPRKTARTKKLIIVIDDDFSTLDLMKIYLQRDYEYMAFDNPKNAIFYLNGNIPDLIFVDSYLNLMSTKRVVEIIRTYKELLGVPIVYLADPSETSSISKKLPDGVVDIITRPVKRADLQKILDNHIKSTDDSDEDVDSIKDHPII